MGQGIVVQYPLIQEGNKGAKKKARCFYISRAEQILGGIHDLFKFGIYNPSVPALVERAWSPRRPS